MRKNLCVEEVEIHKDFALSKLKKYLESELEKGEIKRVNLLAYWFEAFVEFIKWEKTFDPTKMKRYKKGEIVKVNFGFNVGAEFGGLHYAIVLNNKDSIYSSVLTVVPLTSIKEEKKQQIYMINLGNKIYELLNDKIQRAIENIKNTIYTNKSLTTILELNKSNTVEDLSELEKMHKEINKMKKGSYALINQITTISKMRIVNPKDSSDALSGIRLPLEQMNNIQQEIRKFFLDKQNLLNNKQLLTT